MINRNPNIDEQLNLRNIDSTIESFYVSDRNEDRIATRYEKSEKSNRSLLPYDILDRWHMWVCQLVISTGRFTKAEEREIMYWLSVEMDKYKDAARYYSRYYYEKEKERAGVAQ